MAGGDAREINRRRYTAEEVEKAVREPVERALQELVRLRNTHPAFGGSFALPDTPDGELALVWRSGDAVAELRVELEKRAWQVRLSADALGARAARARAARANDPVRRRFAFMVRAYPSGAEECGE